jgi:hypothetical protein
MRETKKEKEKEKERKMIDEKLTYRLRPPPEVVD